MPATCDYRAERARVCGTHTHMHSILSAAGRFYHIKVRATSNYRGCATHKHTYTHGNLFMDKVSVHRKHTHTTSHMHTHTRTRRARTHRLPNNNMARIRSAGRAVRHGTDGQHRQQQHAIVDPRSPYSGIMVGIIQLWVLETKRPIAFEAKRSDWSERSDRTVE